MTQQPVGHTVFLLTQSRISLPPKGPIELYIEIFLEWKAHFSYNQPTNPGQLTFRRKPGRLFTNQICIIITSRTDVSPESMACHRVPLVIRSLNLSTYIFIRNKFSNVRHKCNEINANIMMHFFIQKKRSEVLQALRRTAPPPATACFTGGVALQHHGFPIA